MAYFMLGVKVKSNHDRSPIVVASSAFPSATQRSLKFIANKGNFSISSGVSIADRVVLNPFAWMGAVAALSSLSTFVIIKGLEWWNAPTDAKIAAKQEAAQEQIEALKKLNKKNASLKSTLSRLKSQKEEVDEQIIELRASVVSLTSEKNALNSKLSELNNKLSSLESTLSTLKSEKEEVEEVNNELRASVVALTSEKTALVQENNEVKSQLEFYKMPALIAGKEIHHESNRLKFEDAHSSEGEHRWTKGISSILFRIDDLEGFSGKLKINSRYLISNLSYKIFINGTLLEGFVLNKDCLFDKSLLKTGELNKIRIEVLGAKSPKELGLNEDTRVLGLLIKGIMLS